MLTALLRKQGKEEGSGSFFVPDGLPGFEGGGNRGDMQVDFLPGPPRGTVVIGLFTQFVHLDEGISDHYGDGARPLVPDSAMDGL